MSLQRMRLRAAFVAALINKTIAEGRVFDSRIGEIQEQDADQLIPFVAVYTDSDQRQQKAPGDVTPLFSRSIDVVIELAVGTWLNERDDGSGNAERVFAAPQTDAELEALLDMLEFQIWRAIFDVANSTAAGALQELVKQWAGWDSIPGRSPKGNHKISARQLTITCHVTDDRLPAPGECPPGASVAGLFPPYLAPLVNEIRTQPRWRTLKSTLEQLISPPAPPAGGISFNVQVDSVDPWVDKSLLPEGQTLGPDGRIELEADWQPPETET